VVPGGLAAAVPLRAVCKTWSAICLRSVTPAEIVAAIAQQTGRELEKRDVELPEIKTVGTFDARVRLHPEVFGEFKVVVQREKGT